MGNYYSFLLEGEKKSLEAQLAWYRCGGDPSSEMVGPYVLDQETVNDLISKQKYGWYWLGRTFNANVPQVNYVGRSDTDLAERILKPREHKYRFFWCRITRTVRDAFEGECRDWHAWREKGCKLDNDIHPDEPDDHKYSCPIEGCDEQRGRWVKAE